VGDGVENFVKDKVNDFQSSFFIHKSSRFIREGNQKSQA